MLRDGSSVDAEAEAGERLQTASSTFLLFVWDGGTRLQARDVLHCFHSHGFPIAGRPVMGQRSMPRRDI